jgi:hypothetical protein
MALTPSGILSKPLDLVCDMFSAVAAFQTWCGHTGNASAAKAGHTHIESIGPLAEGEAIERPYLLVMQGPAVGGDSRRGGSGARNHFVHEWELYFRLCAVVSAAYVDDDREAYLEFLNSAGAILSGVELLAGTGGMPNATRWRALGPAQRADKDDVAEGEFVIQEFGLTLSEGS